jgi:hypothetical protein
MPGNIAGACTSQDLAGKDGRLWPAVEKALEQRSSQLEDCWTEKMTGGSSPPPTRQSGLSSNSLHLPRAGGGRRRWPERGRQHPAGQRSSSHQPRHASFAKETRRPRGPPALAPPCEQDRTQSPTPRHQGRPEGKQRILPKTTKKRQRDSLDPQDLEQDLAELQPQAYSEAIAAHRSSRTARGTTPKPPARSRLLLLCRGPRSAEAYRPATQRRNQLREEKLKRRLYRGTGLPSPCHSGRQSRRRKGRGEPAKLRWLSRRRWRGGERDGKAPDFCLQLIIVVSPSRHGMVRSGLDGDGWWYPLALARIFDAPGCHPVQILKWLKYLMVKNHMYQCHPIQQCRLQHQCQFVTFVFSLLELCTFIFVCLLPAASSLDETCSKRGQASVQASKQEHLALVYNFTRQRHTVNLRTARYIQTVKSDPAFRPTDHGDHRSQKS